LAAIALAPVAGEGLLQSKPQSPREVVRATEANAQSDIGNRLAGKQHIEAANAEGKKQLAEESAKLLKLATGLKAEVDKTNQDMLSLTVIRKAGEIERLAHSMRDNTKPPMGAN
jgi:hypothetical protein